MSATKRPNGTYVCERAAQEIDHRVPRAECAEEARPLIQITPKTSGKSQESFPPRHLRGSLGRRRAEIVEAPQSGFVPVTCCDPWVSPSLQARKTSTARRVADPS
jgi:hypothetical protein